MAGDEKRLTESIARRDQEHDMTSPTQRRHAQILARLDALIDAVKHGDKQPGPEPVDVTEEGLPVDTAPDVDPDEALARVACSAFWGGSVMPSQNNAAWRSVAHAVREHIEAERDALRDERDSLRHVLGEERKIARAVESARDEWKARYVALRADVEHALKEAAKHSEWLRAHGEDLEHRGCASHARRELRDLLDRDDERGRDE